MIPVVQITPDGPVAPTRAAISAALWQMMREAFGAGLNEDERTPQGQLVTSWTAALMRRDDTIIETLSQFDPRFAFGVYQEALGSVYFMSRRKATNSVVMLSFIGLPNTVIPRGFVVIDDSGVEWATNDAGTVGQLIQATCLTDGAVAAPANSITTFKVTIDGLDQVTNPQPAVRGRPTETRAEFEERRWRSVAANSKNTNYSVLGAVLNLPGVIDAYVIDNPLATTVTVGETNYSMPQHSLLTVVVGGNDHDIAEQILIKGGTGCTFVGNTQYTYIDDRNELALTHPQYDVHFERPAHVDVYFKITVRDFSSISTDSLNSIKQSIISQFTTGDNRARIAGMVVGNAFMCELGVPAIDIEVSLDGTDWEKFLQFGVDEFPVTQASYISVVGV